MRGPEGEGTGGRWGCRWGFSLVEIMTVLLITSAVARVAVPNYHNVHLRARAAEVAGDFEAVRHAAFLHLAERYGWPEEEPAGVTPEALRPYLPDGFRFRKETYELDWEHWRLPDGLPGNPESGELIGVTLVTEDVELARAVAALLGNTPHYSVSGTYTFVIEGL